VRSRLVGILSGFSLLLWFASILTPELGGAHTGLEVGPINLYPAPIWLIVVKRTGPVTFAILPLVWLVSRLRSGIRRTGFPPGHCANCGYNLAGKMSGACPECGKPIRPEPKK
jgi:hypothetical protein